MAVQRILLGETGQELWHVPPERVTSATYVVEDLDHDVDDSARTLASGAASVSSLSLTSDGVAGSGEADPAQIPVASTSGASAGLTCVIVAADGSFESLTIGAVDSGVSISATHPLLGRYPSGSAVYGVRLSAAVPSSVYTDANDDYVDRHAALQVVWEYTIRGRKRKVADQVRVVRQDYGDLDLAGIEVMARDYWPDMVDRIGTGEGTIRRWVEYAARLVYGELRRKDMRPELLLGGDGLQDAIMFRALHIAANNGVAPGAMVPEVAAEHAETMYRQIFADLTIGTPGVEVSDMHPGSGTAPPKSTRVRSVIKGW